MSGADRKYVCIIFSSFFYTLLFRLLVKSHLTTSGLTEFGFIFVLFLNFPETNNVLFVLAFKMTTSGTKYPLCCYSSFIIKGGPLQWKKVTDAKMEIIDIKYVLFLSFIDVF